jgi:purine catabolism regulator
MKITLKDVMNLNIMQTAEVRTAGYMLKEQLVESVSVMEIPVEDFIEKNEFVLSTAIGCGQTHEFRQFVEEVCLTGASALAIATGRHVMKIPDEILQFAEERRFPIIEIPWKVRFSEITEAILSELNTWQKNILKQSEELQKNLLQQFLEGASLSGAAETIRKAIGRPVLIIDHDKNIVGKSQRSQNLERQKNKMERYANSLDDPAQANVSYCVQRPIQSSSRILGYLLVALPADTAEPAAFLGKGEEKLLEHALTASALWFTRESTIKEVEIRLKDDFVWSLAKGVIPTWEAIQTRAKTLNHEVSKPYVCILGLPENLEMLFWKRKSGRQYTYQLWMGQTIRSIEETIAQVGKALQKEVMITHQEDRFVIFLEIPVDRVQIAVHHFLDEVEGKLNKHLPDILLSWGIGENHAGTQCFHESFKDAKIALNVGKYQKEPGHRSTCANTSMYRALLSLADNKEIHEITLSTIGVLIDHDARRGLDLVRTLTTYIRHQSNVSKTSRFLNLHRQSLLYRLRKIETLTGRSLNDPDDLFLFDLSLKLWTTGLMQERLE